MREPLAPATRPLAVDSANIVERRPAPANQQSVPFSVAIDTGFLGEGVFSGERRPEGKSRVMVCWAGADPARAASLPAPIPAQRPRTAPFFQPSPPKIPMSEDERLERLDKLRYAIMDVLESNRGRRGRGPRLRCRLGLDGGVVVAVGRPARLDPRGGPGALQRLRLSLSGNSPRSGISAGGSGPPEG